MNQLGERLAGLLAWGHQSETAKWPKHRRSAWKRLIFAGLKLPESTFYQWVRRKHITMVPRGALRDNLNKVKLLLLNDQGEWVINEEGFIQFARSAFEKTVSDYVSERGGDWQNAADPIYLELKQKLKDAGYVEPDAWTPRQPKRRYAHAYMRGNLIICTFDRVNDPSLWLPFASPAASYYWLHRFKITRYELRARLGMAADWATRTRDLIDIHNLDHMRFMYRLMPNLDVERYPESEVRWVMVGCIANVLGYIDSRVTIEDWPKEREQFNKIMLKVKEYARERFDAGKVWAELEPARLANWIDTPEKVQQSYRGYPIPEGALNDPRWYAWIDREETIEAEPELINDQTP